MLTNFSEYWTDSHTGEKSSFTPLSLAVFLLIPLSLVVPLTSFFLYMYPVTPLSLVVYPLILSSLVYFLMSSLLENPFYPYQLVWSIICLKAEPFVMVGVNFFILISSSNIVTLVLPTTSCELKNFDREVTEIKLHFEAEISCVTVLRRFWLINTLGKDFPRLISTSWGRQWRQNASLCKLITLTYDVIKELGPHHKELINLHQA